MEYKGDDVSHIYETRHKFTIIGLTGRTGAGCSDVAKQIASGFHDGSVFTDPMMVFKTNGNKFPHTAYRKLRIIFDYAKNNFTPYTLIKYKHIITLFLLKKNVSELISFLKSDDLKKEFAKSSLDQYDFSHEINKLHLLNSKFQTFSIEYEEILKNGNQDFVRAKTYELFFQSDFIEFSEALHQCLGKNADLLEHKRKDASISYHKLIQVICNNLRRSGNIYDCLLTDPKSIFCIADIINLIVREHMRLYPDKKSQIVINSFKNPFEIMYFKQRYAAYYTIAVNSNDESIEGVLRGKFTMTQEKRKVFNLMREEHDGGKGPEFYKQKISHCLQLADIHISFMDAGLVQLKNKEMTVNSNIPDNTSPYFTWQDQILKYISLIDHPGLITPSPEERCMQLAYTAKHNSGCISRHVGAAITDEFYSLKAIGWNNTPEGQVPCVLRKADDLVNFTIDSDGDAFTPFEKWDEEFQTELRKNFEKQIDHNKQNLNGRNACFCFKSIRNSYSEGKNQVHTRSLHAEENAFLQLAKYGATGIKNGKLFSTASPCELCAKKAYQLGIKVIYYIDPYPGISMEHILRAGEKLIDVRLFSGAIGSAYHTLYDPIMPYKDEVSLVLGHEIKDLVTKYKKENDILRSENEELKTLLRERQK